MSPKESSTPEHDPSGEKVLDAVPYSEADISVVRHGSQASQEGVGAQDAAQGGLKRDFKARHMAMISIGGVL
jgi:amino acid permease